MIESTCLWCEATLRTEFEPHVERQTCPECLSSWCFDEDGPEELPAAA